MKEAGPQVTRVKKEDRVVVSLLLPAAAAFVVPLAGIKNSSL